MKIAIAILSVIVLVLGWQVLTTEVYKSGFTAGQSDQANEQASVIQNKVLQSLITAINKDGYVKITDSAGHSVDLVPTSTIQ